MKRRVGVRQKVCSTHREQHMQKPKYGEQLHLSAASSWSLDNLQISESGLFSSRGLVAFDLSLQAQALPCGGHRRTAPGRHLVGRRWPALAQGQGQGPRLGQRARSARKICLCGAVCQSSACRVVGGGSRSAGSRQLAWPQGQRTPKSGLQTLATLIS